MYLLKAIIPQNLPIFFWEFLKEPIQLFIKTKHIILDDNFMFISAENAFAG